MAFYLCATLASTLLAQHGEAGELYSQAPTVGSGYYSTWTSAYADPYLNYYQVLDNFQVSSNATIGSLTWQGMYLNYDSNTGSYSNGPPNTNDWVISLYTAGGPSDFPYTLYATETVPAASVTETLAGTAEFNGGTVDYYDESITLPTGFAIQGGQTYDLSIFSDNGGSTDSWSWMSGTGGDSTSYQYNTYTDSTVDREYDRAFTLYSAPVPEPSSLILALIGFTGLAAAARPRRSCPDSPSLREIEQCSPWFGALRRRRGSRQSWRRAFVLARRRPAPHFLSWMQGIRGPVGFGVARGTCPMRRPCPTRTGTMPAADAGVVLVE
jgi:hypothetical protein